MFDHVLILQDYDHIHSALSGFQPAPSFRGCFRTVLLRRFEACHPDLAAKLKRLDDAELDALYRRLAGEQRMIA